MLVMGISSENSLVVHDIKSLSTFLLLWNWWVKHTVLGTSILMLTSDNLRLSSFKTL